MRRYLLSLALVGLAGTASGQATGPRWAAFAGCWIPVAADGSRNVAANTPRVCVVPSADNNSADLLTVVRDSITERTRIDADGRQQAVSKQGCSGWEKAEFSADGRRLYLRSEQTCAGGIARTTSGIFAIASSGDWVNVTNVAADSTNSVRVTRYGTTMITATMPTEIRETLAARELSDRTARVAAQREVSTAAVVEATRFVAAPTAEAWISELDQDFHLDDKALGRLADEKVPPSVIDMMVAVSNPDVFNVHPTGSITRDEDSVRIRRESYPYCFAPVIDPWAWYSYDPCDPYLRYGYYRSRRFYDPYYGYGYGGGGYYGGYYGGPVIVVRGSGGPGSTGHGRMTKDGYKRDGTSSEGTSSTSGASTDRAPSSSKGSDSGKDSKGSSGSSSSGRTATRKPPAA
jgi:hypothetical protein